MSTPVRQFLPAIVALALATPLAAAEPAAVPAAAPADSAGTMAADLATMRAANPLPVRDDQAVTVTVRPDGTRSVVLDDSYLSTMVVRLGPDGTPVFGCVDTREAYDAFFSPATPVTTPTPEVR